MENVFDNVTALRAKKPQRLPTVLSFGETMEIIEAMTGVSKLAVEVGKKRTRNGVGNMYFHRRPFP